MPSKSEGDIWHRIGLRSCSLDELKFFLILKALFILFILYKKFNFSSLDHFYCIFSCSELVFQFDAWGAIFLRDI